MFCASAAAGGTWSGSCPSGYMVGQFLGGFFGFGLKKKDVNRKEQEPDVICTYYFKCDVGSLPYINTNIKMDKVSTKDLRMISMTYC